MRKVLLLLLLVCAAMQLSAQEFVNLTAEEVRVDTVMPVCHHEFPLGPGFADSTFTVSIDYPEFIDMQPADVERLQRRGIAELPAMPVVEQFVGVSRGRGTLYVSFVPLVMRAGRFQKLVSYRLRVTGLAIPHRPAALSPATRASGAVYAQQSVLAEGQWAKISVPQTGVFQLTEPLVRQCGFSNINRVKIYGYGGALQPEVLTSAYLSGTDDLQEVPQCIVGGRRLFHAVGPVGWASASATVRTRNPYSDVGCYFLTESDDEPLTVDSAAFLQSFYPTANDFHSLVETDDYAWYHSGRNLYESTPIPTGSYRSYQIDAHADSGTLSVVLTNNGPAEASVELNDSLLGTISFAKLSDSNLKADTRTTNYRIAGQLREHNTVRLRQTSGEGTLHLDYLSLTMPTPAAAPDLEHTAFPSPSFVYRITNQNHHADGAVDMVIIIPTSQKLLAQAQRLQQLHERQDSLRVRIVPADELFNEFSSGTPDANAYRRYLKMLYDRADSEADMPRYLLLFGDGAWDNRMLTANWRSYSPDDFLLCYESENSLSATMSYVSDDYFCMLDDGEGGSLDKRDKADVGVGRLTARNEAEAKVLVDKIMDYVNNASAGDWQNTICFMGDDGNSNIHMRDVDAAATQVEDAHPALNIKKYYWDAYERSASSTGYRYPDVMRLVRQQMQTGALVMDYCGHGSDYCISHEQVLRIEDYAQHVSPRLPLWVTASCDIMPFDSHIDNIGETAMLNSRGGAIAFFGTTRTVYTSDNRNMNRAFLRHLLTINDGRSTTLGDAVRLSKNELRSYGDNIYDRDHQELYTINKLHYALLGDPAMRLAMPTLQAVVDSINGHALADGGSVRILAGELVTVKGHVESEQPFDGVVSLTVKDVESRIFCRLNNIASNNDTVFVFNDRPTTIYNGQDSLRAGRFSMTFVLPQDISYSNESGQMIVYAVSSDRQQLAHGQTQAFVMGSGADALNDGVGPSIFCYLNTSDFQNGGQVNSTPYFYAQLADKDGINAAGSSVGHDLELVVDGELSMTYNLDSYFTFDFGDYRSGSVGYSLPQLSPGEHSLTFRAWDVLNNSSVAELKFNVVSGLRPRCFSVECTRNPATANTSFVINHDRTGSTMDVELEVFDSSGRLLWRKSETGVPTDHTYTLDWDLTTGSGSRLQTGVYLYRVLISSDGSKQASQAQKLIILRK